MELLSKLRAFRRVFEAGTITAAARSLEVSGPAVSRALAALEEELDARLFIRTTRRVVATDAGRALYAHSVRLDHELEAARRSVRAGDRLHGRLTVSAPVALGLDRLVSWLPGLLADHPGLAIDLRLEDRAVDLVAEGVDVAVRAGATPRSSASLVARKLYRARRVLVAAPAYLRMRGTPAAPQELARHDLLMLLGHTHDDDRWRFRRRGRTSEIAVRWRLRSSSPLALLAAARRAAGITLLPDWMVQDSLSSGELVALLVDEETDGVDVHALYPVALRDAPRIRLYLEALQANLGAAAPARRQARVD